MRSAEAKTPTQERERRVMSGWVMLPITILLYVAGPVLIALAFIDGTTTSSGGAQPNWWLFAGGIVAILLAALLSPGFFALQPNEARVLILFGDYRGTAKQGGFCWGNPFYSNGPATQSTGQSIWTQAKNKSSDDSSQAQPKKLKRYKISLRARTLNGEKLKVNDKRGNPVDIAAVVVCASKTRPRRCSTSTTSRRMWPHKARRPCGISPAPIRTTPARLLPTPTTRSRCAATSMRSQRRFAWSSPRASSRRA